MLVFARSAKIFDTEQFLSSILRYWIATKILVKIMRGVGADGMVPWIINRMPKFEEKCLVFFQFNCTSTCPPERPYNDRYKCTETDVMEIDRIK